MKQEHKRKVNRHDHAGTAGKRSIFYTVACPIHGHAYPHTPDQKVVMVAPITGRPAKKSGCPLCKIGGQHEA